MTSLTSPQSSEVSIQNFHLIEVCIMAWRLGVDMLGNFWWGRTRSSMFQRLGFKRTFSRAPIYAKTNLGLVRGNYHRSSLVWSEFRHVRTARVEAKNILQVGGGRYQVLTRSKCKNCCPVGSKNYITFRVGSSQGGNIPGSYKVGVQKMLPHRW